MNIKPLKYSLPIYGETPVECRLIKGYVTLYVDADYWILAKGYTLYRYDPKTHNAEIFGKLNDP